MVSDTKNQDAIDAGMKWLDLVDNGHYQESYIKHVHLHSYNHHRQALTTKNNLKSSVCSVIEFRGLKKAR
jgi:hypothetical protein